MPGLVEELLSLPLACLAAARDHRKLRRGQHPCRDRDSVPSVDHRDRPHQLSEFVRLEVRARLLPDLAWDMLIANQSDRVGERERCAFLVVEGGRVVPGGDSVEALLALAGSAGDLRVLVDALRAAVQDRYAQVDEFPQARVELDFVPSVTSARWSGGAVRPISIRGSSNEVAVVVMSSTSRSSNAKR